MQNIRTMSLALIKFEYHIYHISYTEDYDFKKSREETKVDEI